MLKRQTEATMTTPIKTIEIRDVEPSDHPFLFSSYLNNNWYDKTQSTTLKKHTWMALQHKRLEKVLTSGVVKIACLGDEPDIIIGYAFPDGDKPFTYIKLGWRKPQLELTKRLLESIGEKP